MPRVDRAGGSRIGEAAAGQGGAVGTEEGLDRGRSRLLDPDVQNDRSHPRFTRWLPSLASTMLPREVSVNSKRSVLPALRFADRAGEGGEPVPGSLVRA